MSKYIWKILKPQLQRIRRRIFEFFGWDCFSRAALNDLDRKLEKYLPHRNGFFIEAGANDGFSQSNTYYFEKIKGWSGVLIEPVPHLYQKCVRERSKSLVFNCALVSQDYENTHVSMIYSNLMSLVRGAQQSDSADFEHARKGARIQQDIGDVYEFRINARTLTSILDEVKEQDIDLLSLDVEGYELNVLKGLNLNKYCPKFILIESWQQGEIDHYLHLNGYEMIDRLSHHDFLYKVKLYE